jgi:hypothetical protein
LNRRFVPGLLWLVAATVLLLASEVAGILTTGSLAFILVLAGLVLLLCGYAYLKALAFPLGYLIFMTPVLDGLTEPLVWPFQLLTANMSGRSCRRSAFPYCWRTASHHLPTVTLEVVRECSGAGLLIAVLAIGLPLASPHVAGLVEPDHPGAVVGRDRDRGELGARGSHGESTLKREARIFTVRTIFCRDCLSIGLHLGFSSWGPGCWAGWSMLRRRRLCMRRRNPPAKSSLLVRHRIAPGGWRAARLR